MGVRARIVVLSAAAVALAVIAAAVGSYLAVRGDLLGQIDDSLATQGLIAQDLARQGRLPGKLPRPKTPGPPQAAPPANTEGVRLQLLSPEGEVDQPPNSQGRLPVNASALELAAAGSGRVIQDVKIEGESFRVLVVGLGDDGAAMIGRSLEGVDRVLANLRLTLALLALGGIALAVGLALLVGRRVVQPIRELTETAEHISETNDLRRRIEVSGSDEVARLASRFNAMLETIEEGQAALERSVNSQRQLVADASHELRTPVAAIRTDIEAMLGHPELDEAERNKILASADARIEDLTDLIYDVIELARDQEQSTEPAEPVRLDLIAEASIERLRSLAPEREIRSSLAPTVIQGRNDRLFRAINNLLENAEKYSPREQPIEVEVVGGAVNVRDHGPGIRDAEMPRLYDRFWRGADSRHRHGSGLGLAIVKQVAETGGGTIEAENCIGGGTRFRLAFAEVSDPEPAGDAD